MTAFASPKLLILLILFSLWTMTSFLRHLMAAMAMCLYVSDATTSFSSAVIPLLVTFSQLLCYYVLTDVTGQRAGSNFYIMAASHFLATLAVNNSLALTFAASALAVKMVEPTASAATRWLVEKRAVNVGSILSLPVILGGALIYAGGTEIAERGPTARGVLMALVSSLFVVLNDLPAQRRLSTAGEGSALENAGPGGGVGARLSLRRVCVFLLLVVIGLTTVTIVAEIEVTADIFAAGSPAAFALLALGSGLCHVASSHVSANLLPRSSTLTHLARPAEVTQRVLVVLLLHMSGWGSPASLWKWAGLAVSSVAAFCERSGVLSAAMSSASSPSRNQTPGTSGCEDCMMRCGSKPSPHKLSTPCLARMFLCCAALYTILSYSDISGGVCVSQVLRSEPKHPPKSKEDYTILSHSNVSGGVFVSQVLRSEPKHPQKSVTDYASNLRYGFVNWTDGKPLLTGCMPFQPSRKTSDDVEEFLSRRNLLKTPFDTDGLSPYLTSTQQVIEEARRVHFNLFSNLLRGKRYALLFDLPSHENKGDSAIGIGEVRMLETMGIQVLFYVNLFSCEEKNYLRGLKLAKAHKADEVVVLFHGGGNIIGYAVADNCRQQALKVFADYQAVMLSQSIYMRAGKAHVLGMSRLYCCNPRLTILLRDRLSLCIAQRLFNNGTRLLLAPDMAFHNGHVARYAPPFYDVMWQKRADKEAPLNVKDVSSLLPGNVTVHVWDWLNMPSARGTDTLRKEMNILHNAYSILQRGRVVVTDRLHGHILSSLLDIPHVLLDNGQQKLSAYHNTWTRGLANCRLVDNAKDAARLAVELLREFQSSLPRRLTAADIVENETTNSQNHAAKKQQQQKRQTSNE